MARLRSSVRRRNAENNISSLPTELVTEVLALLGSSSFEGLFAAKLSLKMFNEASNYNYIYKKVSLNKLPVVPWRSSRGFSSFMRRCIDSENPEALFRQGVIDFFNLCQHSDALKVLQKAAEAGHKEALYVIGIILILCREDYEEKGFELLRRIRKLNEHREKLRSVMGSIWIRSPIARIGRRSLCVSQAQHRSGSGWERNNEDILCDACRCDREVELVCEMFPRS